MAQWGTSSSSSSESGILRKNKPKDNYDDLLVFGYACKLFRDDEKALYIDQGKHLIPWMGDDNLKIDRYDCRGALSDIKLYESSREGYDTMRWLGLNESERKIEQLCDKERYYALEINEEEERMYKEEEEKRLKANQFQYTYDVQTEQTIQQQIGPIRENNGGGGDDNDDSDDKETFIPPPNLDIPVDIEIPKTVKENARIEKTALFVHKQGPQMEILIKAKQADNPQFGFLNHGHHLYKYYRHILSSIKNGLYHINSNKITTINDTKNDDNGDDNNQNDDHYLHPSLLSTTTTTTNMDDVQTTTTTIPTLQYKPSANCSYSQLVNRIQQQGNLNEQQQQQQQLTTIIDNKTTGLILPPPPNNQQSYNQLNYEQQQYYQYYYIGQYYEYYKQLGQYQQNGGQQQQQQQIQPPDIHLDPSIQNYIQQMAYTQYLQQQSTTTNPYAQIVNNLNNLTNLQQSEIIEKQQDDDSQIVIKSPKQHNDDDNDNDDNSKELKKPLLSLLEQYGSDSDDNNDNNDDDDNKKIPTGEIRIVIDKMASYVAKNGEQFEDIVKAKGDPRFEFLNNNHQYYQYYRNKIKESLNNNNNNNNSNGDEKREVKIMPILPPQKPKEKKIIAPVSFSIKKPKDDGPKEIKSALPIEESDDDDDDDDHIDDNGDSDKVPIENQVTVEKIDPIVPTLITENTTTTNNNNNNDDIFVNDDPILEMIDLTDDIIDDCNNINNNNNNKQRDIKRAEDKIKDKLALAVREKLVTVNRDNRALQLERKRKAAVFLALKSAETSNNNNNNNNDNTAIIATITTTTTTTTTTSSSSSGGEIADLSENRDGQLLKKRSRSRSINVDDVVDGDKDDRRRSCSKKKKSHKRKHSKSKHDMKSRRKSKKKRRRSSSVTSTDSQSS